MGVGVCRHCSRSGVALNAPLCPSCGGEDPCPHVGAFQKRLSIGIGLGLLAVSILLFLLLPAEARIFGVLGVLAAVLLITFGLGMWGRNVIR